MLYCLHLWGRAAQQVANAPMGQPVADLAETNSRSVSSNTSSQIWSNTWLTSCATSCATATCCTPPKKTTCDQETKKRPRAAFIAFAWFFASVFHSNSSPRLSFAAPWMSGCAVTWSSRARVRPLDQVLPGQRREMAEIVIVIDVARSQSSARKQ